MDERHHQALPIGQRLGHYEIRSVLGAGGFGITYLAWDDRLHRKVAIKEYLPIDWAIRKDGSMLVIPRSTGDVSNYTYGLHRFLEEARTLAQFNNTNIIRVITFLETNDTAYMVMEYEEGRPLSHHLVQHDTLDEDEIRRIFIPILRGLEVVHRQAFLHRDIKPDNIYLRAHGPPVLLDFGAARQSLGERSRSMTGVVTPGYAPFEQYSRRGKQGPWTDLYALGATMYRCVCGEKPVEASERIAARAANETDPVDDASLVAAGKYSDELLRTIDWMLNPIAADRPQNVQAVLDRLAEAPHPRPSVTSTEFANAPTVQVQAGSSESTHATTEIATKATPKPATPGRSLAQRLRPLATLPGACGRGLLRLGAAAGSGLRRVWHALRRYAGTLIAALLRAMRTGGRFIQQRIWQPLRQRLAGLNPRWLATLVLVSSLALSLVYFWPLLPGRDLRLAGAPDSLGRQTDDPHAPQSSPETGDDPGGDNNAASAEELPPDAEALPETVSGQESLEAPTTPPADPQVAELLEQGKMALQELRLTTPTGNSALDFFGQALELDANNSIAKAGLRRIVTSYLDMALHAEERGRKINAQRVYGSKISRVKTGIQILHGDANAGQARAQFYVGYQYAEGLGVKENQDTALRWFRAAASQGYAYAQTKLAYMFLYGRGVPRDRAEALRRFRLAALQGNSAAQYALGWMHRDGIGLTRNNAEALVWYRQAAEGGHVLAQANLAYMYLNGFGTAQNYKDAAYWYRKAATRGHATAQTNLGYLYDIGRGVDRDYVQAAGWYRKAAGQGDEHAQYSLGLLYETGRGVDRDPQEAIRWYKRSAAKGHSKAEQAYKRLEKTIPGQSTS